MLNKKYSLESANLYSHGDPQEETKWYYFPHYPAQQITRRTFNKWYIFKLISYKRCIDLHGNEGRIKILPLPLRLLATTSNVGASEGHWNGRRGPDLPMANTATR